MEKEARTEISQELERKASEKIIFFGSLSVLGTAATCAHPVFVAPTIFCYGAFIASFRHYENLVKNSSQIGGE